MVGVKYDYEEIIIKNLINLNSLMPHYWSDFFLFAKQLLNDEEEKKLISFIRDVERYVLEEEFWYNWFKCDGCGHTFSIDDDWYNYVECDKCKNNKVKLIRERQSLYDIEMAIESNRDFTSYFDRYGITITKFDVERKLNKIKEWLFQIIKTKASMMRFRGLR